METPTQKVQTPTVGRIVHFYPGYGEGAYKLPNGMDFAPAIVSQIFDPYLNLVIFVMARPDQGLPYPGVPYPAMNAWSISHLDALDPKNFLPDSHPAYWIYPPKI